MTTVVHGRPGAHAGRLARRALVHAVLWGSISVAAAGGVALVLTTADNPLKMPALIAGVGGGLAAAAVTTRRRGELARALAGSRAETRVARALLGCAPAALVHGATLAGGDADHVVLGPVAVVVETKYGRGEIVITPKGIRVGNKTLPRDPLNQVRRQAGLVAREIGRPVDAVVCVSEGRGTPRLMDGVWVCGPQHLPEVFSRLGHRVGGHEALTLAARLAARKA